MSVAAKAIKGEAIRSGSRHFETRYDFRRRIGATDTARVFAADDEEDEEDGYDPALEEPDEAECGDSEDEDDLGIFMQGAFASPNQPEPPLPTPGM
jgi:hypothetical protein